MENENPDIQWALDLLKPDPSVEKNLFQKYYFKLPVVTIAPGFMCYANYVKGLPYFSRPHYFAVSMGVAYGVSILAERLYERRVGRRDTVMREYIKLHPEDFPPPERKKYGELFTKWIPIR